MKITLLTYGSRGDVQPFLALAAGLQEAGHQVRLALPERLVSMAESQGIAYTALPGDPAQLSQEFNRGGQNTFYVVRAIQKHIAEIAIHVAQAAWEACQGADLVVHSFLFTQGGHAFARRLGIPDVSAQFFPMFAPIRAYPNLSFPELPLGTGYNQWTNQFSAWLFRTLGGLMAGSLRPSLPMLPRRLSWPFDPQDGRTVTPLLLAISQNILSPETHWGKHIHVTGYWFLEEPDYQPPTELKNFLAAGPAPVCVGFGSMIHPRAVHIQNKLLAGLRQAGLRVIVLTGWDDWQQTSEQDETTLFINGASHSWLFPHCSLVIHHGGAGTTAAGLRAGVPNLVLPFSVDQPFWARRVHSLGVGPKPLSINRLDPRSLAGILQDVLANEALKERAACLGTQIRLENGVQRGIQIIEATANGW